MSEAPDWPPIDRLSPANREIVETAREAIAKALVESANPGMAMRGASLAIADHYATEHLARGEASVLRGTRNAFAEIAAERR